MGKDIEVSASERYDLGLNQAPRTDAPKRGVAAMLKNRIPLAAALIVLALAYPSHANQAQTLTGDITAFSDDGNGSVFFVVGRTFYIGGVGQGQADSYAVPSAIPGSAEPVATGFTPQSNPGGPFFVVLANGDVYATDQTSWTYNGNFFSATTPTIHRSLGEIKARYR